MRGVNVFVRLHVNDSFKCVTSELPMLVSAYISGCIYATRVCAHMAKYEPFLGVVFSFVYTRVHG